MARPIDFNFAATCVGSDPRLDVAGVCRTIPDILREVPFWPQFVRLDPREDMILQFSEGIPCLRPADAGSGVVADTGDIEKELTAFYERFLSEDLDHFAMSRDRARGLFEILEIMKGSRSAKIPYIKGQTVGPITFAESVHTRDGRSILHIPELLDTVVKGLAAKLLWQDQLLGTTGKQTILFIDEPVLSGIGSAFSSIDRQGVVRALREIMGFIRERSNALIGIHCCGNTDWPMILETGPDIINFDAFNYMDQFLLYPRELTAFLKNGGTIAWGIVPTEDFSPGLDPSRLQEKMREGLDEICSWGLDPQEVRRRSMLTPACGMGTMTPEEAGEGLHLLALMQEKMRV